MRNIHKSLTTMLINIVMLFFPITIILHYRPNTSIFVARQIYVDSLIIRTGIFHPMLGVYNIKEILSAILAIISGINITQFRYLPLAMLMIVWGYLVYLNKISPTLSLATIGVASIIYNPSYGISFFTVISHGLGLALYIFFLHIFFHKSLFYFSTRAILLLFLLMATLFSYYFAFIGFVLCVLMFLADTCNQRTETERRHLIVILAILDLIIITMYHKALYLGVIPKLLDTNYLQYWNNFLEMAFKYVIGSTQPQNEYTYVYTPNKYLALLSILHLTTFGVVNVIFGILTLKYILPSKDNLESKRITLVIISGAMFMLTYVAMGYFNFLPLTSFSILWAYSLLKDSIALQHFNIRKIAYVVIIILFTLSFIKYSLALHENQLFEDSSPSFDGIPSALWLATHSDPQIRVLGGFDELAHLYIAYANLYKYPRFLEYHFDFERYRNLVTGKFTATGMYIIIDFGTDKGVETDDWGYFKPLKVYKTHIKSSTLNSVYSSANMCIVAT